MKAAVATIGFAAVLAIALADPSPGQGPAPPDSQGYCVPESTQYDPQDVHRPDAPPIELPPGFTRHRIRLAGFTTSVIERGPRDSREAIVFMHGNPGNSLDFLGLLPAVPKGTRVIAFDIIGFGAADKPYSFSYELKDSRPILNRAMRQLGIRRMHLVGHDVGSVVGVDYAARHPRRLASATLIAGGILIGYVDHHFARVWKTPGLGEESMRGVDREGFVSVIQAHNPRPLPREFLDRNYDYFDRGTRCAILRLYRAAPDLDKLGREHAAALRPYDRPALVIWGDRDPFLPQHLARSNREGFPHADVHVFENSGHWPFVDTEARTVELMRAFLARHVREQAGKRIRLSVRPRRIDRRDRTRLRVRTVLAQAPRQPVAGARVRVRGKRVRTGSNGRARIVLRPRSAGRLRITARKPPLRRARASVRVRPSG